MNKRIRTYYPAEFKRQAVERAKAGDRSVRSLEIEMGLSANLLRQWVQAYDAKGEKAFVSKAGGYGAGEVAHEGVLTAEQEVRLLKQRIARLEEERTILKKALQLLSQEQ